MLLLHCTQFKERMLPVDRWRGHVVDVIVKRDGTDAVFSHRSRHVCTKPFYLNGMLLACIYHAMVLASKNDLVIYKI